MSFRAMGQQADGHLFAGSENDVEFARIGMLFAFRAPVRPVGWFRRSWRIRRLRCRVLRRGLWRHVWLLF